MEDQAANSSCGQKQKELQRLQEKLKVEASCDIYKKPGGTKLTSSIDIPHFGMKQYKPMDCVAVKIFGQDLSIDFFPNGRTEELKGLMCVALENTGRGEVKVGSVKITLAGKTNSGKDWNISPGKLLSCDGIASFDKCPVKSGVIKLNLELDGLFRKQEFKEETVKNSPLTKTAGMNGRSANESNESFLKKKKKSRRKNNQETVKESSSLKETCWNCSITSDVEKLFQCADCRAAWYCGVKCQRQDWEKHWEWCQEKQDMGKRKKKLQNKGDEGEKESAVFSTSSLASTLDY